MQIAMEVLLGLVIVGAFVWGLVKGVTNPPPKPEIIATYTTRRPTVTRVGAGLLLGGLPGGLLGLAFRKKSRERIERVN